MKHRVSPLVLGTLAFGLLSATTLASTEFKAAPPLEIAKWLKGTPVKAFEPGKVYVVEFWATWCPPCIQSIPHLTELQQKFAGKAQFIGISDETLDVVEPFVADAGDQMAYTVAIDANAQTSTAYKRAYGVGGIPHAFVVDQKGRMVFHCHPMDPNLEKVLAMTVAGEFTEQAAAELVAAEEAAAKARAEANERFKAYAEVITADRPDPKQASELGDALYEVIKDQSSLLDQVAWSILASEEYTYRDVPLALKMSERAMQLTEGKSPVVLDTYAKALFMSGKKAEAVAEQKKAVELSADLPEQAQADFKQRLSEYEQAVAAK